MIKVGITGGIGSGKTIVCKVFALLGIPVYYSDEKAKWLLGNDDEVRENIIKSFGKDVLNETENIDRKKLSALVFADKNKLEKLNAIVHPAVARHFDEWATKHKEQKYILKEAAILFESGANKQVDTVITVTAPSSLKIKRAMQRDNITAEQVEQRMKNQWTDEEKIKLSAYVIVNDEEQLLIPQVIKIHELLSSF
jgi:dephospho-CoA kinase